MQLTTANHLHAAPLTGFLAAFVTMSLLITPTRAEARDKTAQDIAWEHHFWLYLRVPMIRPQRKDGPLRYRNISDDEVREIQGAASEVVGNVLVQIGGVTTGCPCEDGPNCTDQVWVQAEVHDKPLGLLLSRTKNHWVIGPVQRWWWRYEKADYWQQEKIIDELPDCGIDETKADFYRRLHLTAPAKAQESH
jgi:hypothetical protein